MILKHKKGHWSFAKGHRDKDESALETAARELHEEAGIDEVVFLSKKIMIKENYVFINKNKDTVKKEVCYFIAESKFKSVKIDRIEIINYRWCTAHSAEKLVTHRESRQTLRNADKLILKNK